MPAGTPFGFAQDKPALPTANRYNQLEFRTRLVMIRSLVHAIRSLGRKFQRVRAINGSASDA